MKQKLYLILLTSITNYETYAFIPRSQLHMSNGDRMEQGRVTPNALASTTTSAPSFDTNTEMSARKPKKAFKQRGIANLKSAPLVDSTLLRFLSSQKDQLAQNKENIDSLIPTDFLDDEIELAAILRNTTDGVDIVVNEEDIYESSVSTVTKDTPAENLSWFTQYNARQVAQKLIALGATKDCAEKAGMTVQNYSLGRTTRQRVRKFLRDRDRRWASGSTDFESTYEVSNIFADSNSRGSHHNIDEVISLLSDASLTGRDIAAIFIHTPSVSMMRAKRDVSETKDEDIRPLGITLEETLERAYFGVLCSSIKLRKYDARKVLRMCPGLLTKRGSTNSEEIISILSNLGVSPTSLCRDKCALPMLLSRSPASLFRFVAFLSSDAVRMPLSQIGPFIRRSECSRVLDLVAPLPPIRGNLFDDPTSVLDEENLDMLPPIRSTDYISDSRTETDITKVYKNMFDMALFLRKEVGVENLGKVISSFPDVFLLDTHKKVIPVIDFLSDELYFEKEDIVRVLQTYPILLGTDVSHMKEVIEYFISLEVEEQMIPSIFRAFPSLLSQGADAKMNDVIDFLKKIGVSNIGRFVTRLPPVLTYSVQDELIPKWDYLTRVCQFPSFEIGRFPAYFSYPLERVIINRFEYLRRVKRIPLHYFPVDEVLRYGDDDFATLVAQDTDGKNYATFVKMARNARLRHAQAKANKLNESKNDISQ